MSFWYGGWGGVDTDHYVDLNVYSNVYENTYSNVFIRGNTADASAEANAYGDNTFSFAGTETLTTDYASHSASASTSATGPSYHRYY